MESTFIKKKKSEQLPENGKYFFNNYLEHF